jgi:DNA replication protein DnaC
MRGKDRKPRRPARAQRASRPDVAPPSSTLERLHAHLDRLGLGDLKAGLPEQLAWARATGADGLDLLERVLGEAAARKLERAVERRITSSGLRTRRTLEAFDWAFQPKLDRALILELASFRFVGRGEDLLITGKSGTGKSHLLQALALRACQRELPVRYVRCVDLLDDLHAGLADGSYQRRLAAWTRPVLLVLDDVGLGYVKKRDDEPTAAHSLFNLLDRRHEDRRSTAMSSNIRLAEWGRYLGDAALAAAVLDRLAENSIRVDIDGPSYRQHVGRQRAQQYGKDVAPE